MENQMEKSIINDQWLNQQVEHLYLSKEEDKFIAELSKTIESDNKNFKGKKNTPSLDHNPEEEINDDDNLDQNSIQNKDELSKWIYLTNIFIQANYLHKSKILKNSSISPIKFYVENNKDLYLKQEDRKISVESGSKTRKMILLILRRQSNWSKLRIRIFTSVKKKIYMKIFMNKEHLEKLCLSYSYAPKILKYLIEDYYKDNYHDNLIYLNTNDIPINNNFFQYNNENILSHLKINPFQYQLNNVNWMYELERKADLGLTKNQYLEKIDLYTYPIGDIKVYMDKYSKILYNDESLWNYSNRLFNLSFRGGVLCDEVGLGKTLSLFSLILKNQKKVEKSKITPIVKKPIIIKKKPMIQKKAIKKEDLDSASDTESIDENNIITNKELENITNKDAKSIDVGGTTEVEKTNEDEKSEEIIEVNLLNPCKLRETAATLLICPARLCQQWEDEILIKYLKDQKSFNIIKITSKLQLDKIDYDDLCEADLIIVSFNFLINANYYQNQSRIQFEKLHWHRIILDEGHEVLLPNAKKKYDIMLMNTILSISASYKWYCTGDPLARNFDSFQGILCFLTGKTVTEIKKLSKNLDKDDAMEIIANYFHRNSKEKTKDHVYIPELKENTIFLDFSPTERAIYNNAEKKGGESTRLMQLCTNILISDYESNIIGNRIVDFNQINLAMAEHFRENVENLKNLIQENIDTQAKIRIDYPKEIALVTKDIDFLKKKSGGNKTKLSPLDQVKLEELTEQRKKLKNSFNYYKKALVERHINLQEQLKYSNEQIKLFTELNLTNMVQENCPICLEKYKEVSITKCGHIFCYDCVSLLFNSRKNSNCPFCREAITTLDINRMDPSELKNQTNNDTTNQPSTNNIIKSVENKTQGKDRSKVYQDTLEKYGTKMAYLVKYLYEIFDKNNDDRVILFSQWNKMLNLVGKVLNESDIKHVFCRGNVYTITKAISNFKRDPDIRVIMLSSENCSSGNNLTEASHIILLDTVNTTKDNALAIENQAIGRAVRLGQNKNVVVTRLIIKDSIEEEHYKRNYQELK